MAVGKPVSGTDGAGYQLGISDCKNCSLDAPPSEIKNIKSVSPFKRFPQVYLQMTMQLQRSIVDFKFVGILSSFLDNCLILSKNP